MKRTQIYLSDALYFELKNRSKKQKKHIRNYKANFERKSNAK